jgi:hypothetical protein
MAGRGLFHFPFFAAHLVILFDVLRIEGRDQLFIFSLLSPHGLETEHQNK